MSTLKSILAFFAKSVSFAVISGMVWVVIGSVAFHLIQREANVSSQSYNQQVEIYNKQVQQAEEQFRKNNEIQDRSVKLLESQERLMVEQEKQQKRFSALLDLWEENARRK